MTDINPLVVDLSHWDPASDYSAVKRDGIVGVIYKATEGTGYTDPTYVSQQQAAKKAGLKWGAYHFATAASLQGQIENFLRFAAPDPDELFCLDWEDYGSNTMSQSQAETWIREVENALRRPGQCVLYSGNTAKEALGNKVNKFFGERRLWLCQYGSKPVWQKSWEKYWLWQYTDGLVGPEPHSISGIGPCDVNSYDNGADMLIAEWATGKIEELRPPAEVADVVHIMVHAPPGVTIKVHTMSPDQMASELAREKEARG